MEKQPLSSIEKKVIEAQVIEALRTCYDPEIPVNIYEMGLIYSITISDNGNVEITMTLTSPYCPAIQSLPAEIEEKVIRVHGVTTVKVNVVWDPQWDPSKMTEAARLELGLM
jgi:FeS assembly SUF system protein